MCKNEITVKRYRISHTESKAYEKLSDVTLNSRVMKDIVKLSLTVLGVMRYINNMLRNNFIKVTQ